MGDENHIRTLRDYSKPSHEGYMNTIELPVGNNVVPFRSDTIRLVQKGCSFYGLRSKDPNQHLKDFLKLVDSLYLDGSITKWEDLTTRFLAHFFPPERTAKLRNDILIRTINQSTGGKLHDRNAKESWALLEDLALYNNESWNDPMDFAKPVKAIALPQDVPSRSDCRLIELENQVQRLMEAHLALTQPTQIPNAHLTHPLQSILSMHIPRRQTFPGQACCKPGWEPQQPEEPEPTLEDEFQDLHVNLPVLKVLDHSPIYNALLDKYVESLKLGKNGSTYVQGEREIARDAELNPFKDVLVFRRMVEFLGAIPINLKSNMWESEGLNENPINWDKPPKNGDGAWHAKIRLIDPDGEEFTKTLQSIPTTRKLSERESRKAHLLGDKQIPSVGVFDEVFSTWMTFGGNTRDLGSFGEETDEITDLHQIHKEILFSEHGHGVTDIKRHRRDPSSDGGVRTWPT
ncbi:hypothetical protein Tco_1026406 [Tanacetum coccineum]